MKKWWTRLFSTAVDLPQQWQQMKVDELPLLAIDLELTSLDVKRAKITSIGWVAGCGHSIALDSCFYKVIKTKGDLEQSPVIHGLIAEQVAKGAPIKAVLETLVPYASSHVWVLHNASLDMGVLDNVMAVNGISCPQVITLDTLKLAVYQLKKQHAVLPPNSATLTVCRQRYNLPLAPAHNALDDAMATLQLWFAQQHDLDSQGRMRLKDLAHTRAVDMFCLGEKLNT
jgi:DNA polymerase-3 subunit epsilon